MHNFWWEPKIWEGGGQEKVSYLEILGLSSQSDGIHHGDEDGDVAQGAAHSARYADAQRISGAFSELHCSDFLMLRVWNKRVALMTRLFFSRNLTDIRSGFRSACLHLQSCRTYILGLY